jgi:dihydroorotate dehydrogenase
MLLDYCWAVAKPMLFRLEAERAHRMVLENLAHAPTFVRQTLGALSESPAPELAGWIAGIPVRSPVGLAAGLDKDGEAIWAWERLGFGFAELGTVTPKPQAGNPAPRLFRFPAERALLNRMGFNNGGAPQLAERLKRAKDDGVSIPLGANIGKNKDTPNESAELDYAACIKSLRGPADWFTVNVSSPNTPGLRALQEAGRLRAILEVAVEEADGTPVFLKLAPDLEPDALREAVEVAIAAGCRAIVATNTTLSRPGRFAEIQEAGGLSGDPLWELASSKVAAVCAAANRRIDVIGVGGIRTAAQVDHHLRSGCTAVQVYSAFIFEGPSLAIQLNRGLLAARRTPRQLDLV